MSLEEKLESWDEYKTVIFHKVMHGPYEWCGRGESIDSANYLFSTNSTSRKMLKIDIYMSKKLRKRINNIMVCNLQGGCVQYSFSTPKHYSFYFSTTEKKLHIKFVKYLPRPPGSHPLNPPPFKIIHQDKLKVPKLQIRGEHMCSICMEPAGVENDSYLSECKHIFHNKCIIDYLRTIKKLKKDCDRCKHGENTQPFKCPNCNTLLETNRSTPRPW